MVLNICNNSGVLGIFYLCKLAMQIICYSVPVILILAVMIKLVKSLINNEENVVTFKSIVNKIVASIIVFMVPTMVNLFLTLVGGSLDYQNCLEMATLENIQMYKEIEANKRKQNSNNDQENTNPGNNGESDGNNGETTITPPKIDVNDVSYGDIVTLDLSNVKCGVYYAGSKLKSLQINNSIKSSMTTILNNICTFINTNSYVDRLDTAGTYNPSGSIKYPHAYAMGIDLFNNWSYTENGKTYYPYASQGNTTWNNYKSFICEVCDGKEDCDKNINYQIYKKYFEPAGYCWGGNWGPSSFDPMHYEYSKNSDYSCSTRNKGTISC